MSVVAMAGSVSGSRLITQNWLSGISTGCTVAFTAEVNSGGQGGGGERDSRGQQGEFPCTVCS